MSTNPARRDAIKAIASQPALKGTFDFRSEKIDLIYGQNVFSLEKMEKRLPKDVFKSLKSSIETGTKLDGAVADTVAAAIKDWALERGASHYAHVFYPLTGLTAEKHDTFFEPHGTGTLAQFSGKALIQAEPDASSFPNGGLRSTFEARGYTAWDVTSPAFILDGVNGSTLCIPTAFVSWKGEALDKKTPLLRSMHAVNKAAQRVLAHFGKKSSFISASCGPEQEYFLIDSRLFYLRPDLYTCGRSLFGAKPAKGQEFEDQYFGTIPDRVLACMMETERECFKLGIPIKTRHNEVAPAQYEVAPIYESANVAHDHQMLTMTLLKRVAAQHGFVCLLAEKPFAGVNGSGKHVNWSIGGPGVGNLLEPGTDPHANAQFLAFCTAVIRAVDKHQGLLRASVASAGNDHRLGANEAPPAIISIYLGDMLNDVIEQVKKSGAASSSKKGGTMHIGVDTLPVLPKDAGDRNRTSPCAFTGNKFEFRAVGSAFSVAGPLTVLNTILADSLCEMDDELTAAKKKQSDFNKALESVLKDILTKHGRIIFNGNGYSEEWHKEAAKRGLKNLRTTPDALPEMVAKSTVEVFERQGVLSKAELESREEIYTHSYVLSVNTESKLAHDIGRTMLLPAALKFAAELTPVEKSKSGGKLRKDVLALADKLAAALDELDDLRAVTKSNTHAQAHHACDKVLPAMLKARGFADALEDIVSDEHWPLPSYQEMLFLR
ncbi:MAG: glutamine synthetase III [Verrucomicrobiota bacterium]